MNDDFEQFLAKQPPRSIPPEWRSQILHSARSRTAERTAPPTPWWHALFWPSPVAWGCVLGAWLLIIGMNIAARPPAGEMTIAPASASSPDLFSAIMQERQLVQEFYRIETEPAEPPRKRAPSGACNDLRKQDQTETA